MEYTSPGRRPLPRIIIILTLMLYIAVTTTGTNSRHQTHPDFTDVRYPDHAPPGYQEQLMKVRHVNKHANMQGDSQSYRDFSDYDFQDPTVIQQPRFLKTAVNVTAVEGRMATLPCSVQHLGTKKVAWVRLVNNKNLFLTVGALVWVRKKSLHVAYEMKENQTTKWDLQIKSVEMRDAGTYQCQITDKDPLRKHVLLIVKPRPPPKPAAVTLTGEPYVDQGKSIKLRCNATGGARVPDGIDWFKDGSKLDANFMRGVSFKIVEYMHVEDQALISDLVIHHAENASTGTYICRSSDNEIAGFRVTVLVADTTNVKRETIGKTDESIQKSSAKMRNQSGAKDSAVFITPSTTATAIVTFISLMLCWSFNRLIP